MTGIPKRIFISVDLPAPFSPKSAWISPEGTASETPFTTRTPSYSLVMSRSSRAGAPGAAGSPPPPTLVVDVADKEQVGVALGRIVLGDRDRDAGFLFHVLLHRRRVFVVGLALVGIDHQVGHRADREHDLRHGPRREVAGHVVVGDHLLVLGVD